MTPVLTALYAIIRYQEIKLCSYVIESSKHCYISHDILHYHFSIMNL